MEICFRLLTEYHSFLFFEKEYITRDFIAEFPSPYGVSFILINRNFSEEESVSKDSFHLLTEYRSFLLKA